MARTVDKNEPGGNGAPAGVGGSDQPEDGGQEKPEEDDVDEDDIGNGERFLAIGNFAVDELAEPVGVVFLPLMQHVSGEGDEGERCREGPALGQDWGKGEDEKPDEGTAVIPVCEEAVEGGMGTYLSKDYPLMTDLTKPPISPPIASPIPW